MRRRDFLKAVPVGTAAAIVAANSPLVLAKGPEDLKGVSDEEVEKIKAAVPKTCPVKPTKRRKILVFWQCNAFYHQSIPCGCRLIELMGKETGAYEATVPPTASEQMGLLTPGNLDQYDAVVFNNSTHLKPDKDQQKALMDFVNAGKGVIAIHAGADNFYPKELGGNEALVKMVGGHYRGHPWHAGHKWGIKVECPDHPINRAFAADNIVEAYTIGGKECTMSQGAFETVDEIYKFGAYYSRNDRRVLLTLDKNHEATEAVSKKSGRPDGDNPISWLKRQGDGRVFYCSLGHHEHNYWDKRIAPHYLAGIQYAIGDLKADDSPG
jgi:hypothetical protein